MPSKGLSSLSGTAIQSISRRMKSSVVVGAHGAAENDRSGVVAHGFRQGIAEARPAHVDTVSKLLQGMADPSGCGVLLVQNDQDRLWHSWKNEKR